MSTPNQLIPASFFRIPAVNARIGLNLAVACPAVTRCSNAWNSTYQAEKDKGADGVNCHLRANEAYRNAMPPLTTTKNIRDFVACTAFGMMAGSVNTALVPQLLYAAQVACSTQRLVFSEKHPRSKSALKTKKTRVRSGSRKQKTTQK